MLHSVEPTLKISEQSPADAEGFVTLRLTTERDEPLGELLLKALYADGRFRLRGLSQVQSTLEDVFLAATKRTWELVDRPGHETSAT